MTMITPSYLGETIEYSSLHACRSTLEDPTADLCYGPHIHRWFTFAIERPETPHLRAWYDRLLALPVYAKHIAITPT